VLRASTSPERNPGNSSDGDQATVDRWDPRMAPRMTFNVNARLRVPNRRVRTLTGIRTPPWGASRGLPVTCEAVAVAIASARS
jgi:hypothetical protein